MCSSTRFFRVFFLVLVMTGLFTVAAVAAEGVVKGWFKAGNDPSGYIIGTEKIAGETVAYIKAVDPEDEKFGTLMQSFLPDQYIGQRVRMSARVKNNDVQGWAGMWLRVDADGKSVSFDNMKERKIVGTKDWHECFIVLDVPAEADNMAMGMILSGKGEVYWDNLKIEEVGKDVPLTGIMTAKSGPSNMSFED